MMGFIQIALETICNIINIMKPFTEQQLTGLKRAFTAAADQQHRHILIATALV